MEKSETVEFMGIKFRRYPESADRSIRDYYRPGPHLVARGVESLHREVWKSVNGPIPDGWHVHHVDGNTLNNDPSNLECLPAHEHLSHHGAQPSESKRSNLDRIRHLASAWHASDAGRAWHAEHGRKTWVGRAREERVCAQCGRQYKTPIGCRQSKFCSNNCKSASRRDSGVDAVDRSCVRCGNAFRVNRYSAQRYCGRSCSARHRFEL